MPQDDGHSPALFFAPFVSSSMRVEPSWLDPFGRTDATCYQTLFERAFEEALELIGLHADAARRARAALSIRECRLSLRRPLSAHAPLRATLQLLGIGPDRLHAYLELREAATGDLWASAEIIALHLDLATREPTPFPARSADQLSMMRAVHSRLPLPARLGEGIAFESGDPGAETEGARLDPPALGVGTRH